MRIGSCDVSQHAKDPKDAHCDHQSGEHLIVSLCRCRGRTLTNCTVVNSTAGFSATLPTFSLEPVTTPGIAVALVAGKGVTPIGAFELSSAWPRSLTVPASLGKSSLEPVESLTECVSLTAMILLSLGGKVDVWARLEKPLYL